MTQSPAQTRTLTLGHSPDADDAFMFYALAAGKIPTEGYKFEHVLQDIQTLNERATRGELDITAISIHAYAYLTDLYAVLPSGASMGDNYGPQLIAREAIPPFELHERIIAVPGEMTSAFLALCLYFSTMGIRQFRFLVVPFDEIMAAVKDGRADVGLIIHEGQLTFEAEGFVALPNLGEWWFRRTNGLPLPLGCNVIRKDFGPETMSRISRILTESIRYSLENREAALDHAMQYSRDLERPMADKFVGMYVNELTMDYGDRGRLAIERFLREAHEHGLIPPVKALEFVA